MFDSGQESELKDFSFSSNLNILKGQTDESNQRDSHILREFLKDDALQNESFELLGHGDKENADTGKLEQLLRRRLSEDSDDYDYVSFN